MTTSLQARVKVDIANDFNLAADERGQTSSELLRNLVEDFLYTKEGHLKQAEFLELKALQHRQSVELIEQKEAQQRKHQEEMRKMEEEKKQKQQDLELQKQEMVKISEEARKVWQGKTTIKDINPEIRGKVEEKLAEWKAKDQEWNKPNTTNR